MTTIEAAELTKFKCRYCGSPVIETRSGVACSIQCEPSGVIPCKLDARMKRVVRAGVLESPSAVLLDNGKGYKLVRGKEVRDAVYRRLTKPECRFTRREPWPGIEAAYHDGDVCYFAVSEQVNICTYCNVLSGDKCAHCRRATTSIAGLPVGSVMRAVRYRESIIAELNGCTNSEEQT